MDRRSALVLTYHSIGPGGGPTTIAPAVFEGQMQALADLGWRSLTIAEFLAWRRGELSAERRVLITFDDGFRDFAETAAPILARHGFTGIVFLPTGRLGGLEEWDGGHRPARPLMTWDEVEALARDGFEFGGHGVRHQDLTTLDADGRRDEIAGSGAAIAERLGAAPQAFAAPYGRVDEAVLNDIETAYAVSFGTRLGRARPSDRASDVPRIEMYYFQDLARWRGLLNGGDVYLTVRKALRAVRERLVERMHA